MIKNSITSCLALLVLLLAYSCCCAASQELVICNWGDYFDPELQQRFETEYDAKISFIYYANDEKRTELLQSNNAQGIDLILTAGIDLQPYVEKGWLAPLERQRIPNLRHLDTQWRTAYPMAERYGVPYAWGTLGIVYRTDLISTPITSWRQLFQPDKPLQGKIGMISDSRELLGMALKALGYSANSIDRAQLEEAGKLLLQQKPAVKSYLYLSVKQNSALVSGEILAAMAFSGDALLLHEYQPQLEFVLPEEGGRIWVDYFALGARAPNPDLAHKFLDFINRPTNAAMLAEYLYVATPNLAAQARLPQQFVDNPIIYPTADALARSEYYEQLPPRIQRLRNHIGFSVLRQQL